MDARKIDPSATKLNARSKQVRRETLKLSKANGGYHYGGCFSTTEILINLYDSILKKEDRFILSKGHACWPLYVLLRERGLDPKLEGHPYLDPKNGVNCITGSEGHGFPTGVGMAFARKIQGRGGHVYVIVGDGECQEGTTWESLLLGARFKLDNLTVVMDYNKIQGAGFVADVLPVDSMDRIAEVLGWSVDGIDGHSNDEIIRSLGLVEKDKPRFVVAHTVKGKGVSYMENEPQWHAKWPDEEHEKRAFAELA